MLPVARSFVRRSALCALFVGLALLAVPALAVAATPGAPVYAYWYSSAQAKVYPTTAAPATAPRSSDASSAPVLALSAARAESEGRQIVVHALGTRLQDLWIQPSDLTLASDAPGAPAAIPASAITVYKVGYVNVAKPSWGMKRTGLQPDPLLPMTLANGLRLGWRPAVAPDLGQRGVPAATTQPFYVLIDVPKDAVPGTYAGSLTITASDAGGLQADTVVVPVSLTVYPFSIEQRTLKTAFGFDTSRAQLSNSASGRWLWPDADPGANATRVPERTWYYGDQFAGWLTYMSDHRITPQAIPPAWQPPSNGYASARTAELNDYLGTGPATTLTGDRLAFNTVKLPVTADSWAKNPFSSGSATTLATRYFASAKTVLGADAAKAYVYAVDEPTYAERRLVERYAALVHKAAPGLKYLVTADAVTQRGKLITGVDIYVYRLAAFYRDATYISKIRAAKREVWIYSHGNNWQGATPMYLVDKPLTDSRAQAWFAYKLRATGLLYFSIDRWRKPSSTAARDPYLDPLSGLTHKDGKPVYANGDGSLVYPGYYPRLGLVVEGAPPVGSLRMEALRDGLEDYEYVKLVAARYGTAAADAFAARIIGPKPKPISGKPLFPKYATTASVYEQVRGDMAARLSQ